MGEIAKILLSMGAVFAFLIGVAYWVEHETPEQIEAKRQQFESHLPPGCELRDLGPYREFKRVVVVVCDGRTSTSALSWRTYQSGKTHHEEQFLVVDIEEKGNARSYQP